MSTKDKAYIMILANKIDYYYDRICGLTIGDGEKNEQLQLIRKGLYGIKHSAWQYVSSNGKVGLEHFMEDDK